MIHISHVIFRRQRTLALIYSAGDWWAGIRYFMERNGSSIKYGTEYILIAISTYPQIK